MLEIAECQENGFDGLHCPRWYHGGSCSYCGKPATVVQRAQPVRVCLVRDAACVEVPAVQQCTDCPERRTSGVDLPDGAQR